MKPVTSAFFRAAFFFLLVAGAVQAQTTGKVDFKHLGISFSVPDGWVGQEMAGGYLMGSHSEPGLIMLILHDITSMEAMRTNARQGIRDEGVFLMPAGDLEGVGSRGVGGVYSGTLNGQKVTSYIVGLVNPHGSGVTIMAATDPAKYSATYRKLALAVANSTQFYKAEKLPVVDEWKQALVNHRLTYMDSYYSSGSSYGGYSSGGGYSTKVEIDLCAEGHFKHSNHSSMSVDTGGAFGSSANSGSGSGQWSVVGGTGEQAVLVLNFHDGNQSRYNLNYRDKKTLLNGERWFRTEDAICP